jgi:hypothetical protein
LNPFFNFFKENFLVLTVQVFFVIIFMVCTYYNILYFKNFICDLFHVQTLQEGYNDELSRVQAQTLVFSLFSNIKSFKISDNLTFDYCL